MGYEASRGEAKARATERDSIAFQIGDIKTENLFSESSLPRRTFEQCKIEPTGDDEKAKNCE